MSVPTVAQKRLPVLSVEASVFVEGIAGGTDKKRNNPGIFFVE